MGQEIESKMRLRDRDGLTARLRQLVGGPAREFIETDVFLDTADAGLRAADSGLRVRVEADVSGTGGRQVIITFKGPRQAGRWKTREEIELTVDDERRAIELLGRLGYAVKIRFQKRRQRWEVGGCHVEVDHLPYLGDFVEVEGPSEAAVTAVLEQLGLAAEPMVKESYVAMLHAHLERHGIVSRDIAVDADGVA